MKTAIVTGISSDIGEVLAAEFKNAGWQVVGLTRRNADLSDLKETAKFAQKLAKKYAKIDALIHIAGVWHDKTSAFANKDLEDFTPEQIVQTMNVGLTSFMVLAAALLPKLSKSGVVIGISGTFGDGASGWLPYYTSKRGLEDFLKGLAEDYPKGPKIYGVSPADTATKAYKKFYPEYAADAQRPETVARLIFELTQNKSLYKSGEIVEIRDGKHQKGFHS